MSYADGVGVHWYWNRITPANFLRFAKTEQKDLFLLGTEASVGKFKFKKQNVTRLMCHNKSLVYTVTVATVNRSEVNDFH